MMKHWTNLLLLCYNTRSEAVTYNVKVVMSTCKIEMLLLQIEKSLDQQFTTKALPFGENLMKVGPVDPEMIDLQEIVKR